MRGKRKRVIVVTAASLIFLVIATWLLYCQIAKAVDDTVTLNASISMTFTFKALPEKISPMTNDYSSHVIIEIKPAGGSTVLYSEILDTDITGMHSTPETLNLEVGTAYDIFAKGYSHLTKKKASVVLYSGENFIDFSDGDTLYLLAGDVNILDPLDLKQRGDDLINAIDLAIEIENLDQSVAVEKEDVNKDGMVNSVDLGIAIENLDKAGEN